MKNQNNRLRNEQTFKNHDFFISIILYFFLRHQLQVKMTVEKTVKTGSDVNPKTNLLSMNICIISGFDQNDRSHI